MHAGLALLSDIKQSQNVLINFIRNPQQKNFKKICLMEVSLFHSQEDTAEQMR